MLRGKLIYTRQVFATLRIQRIGDRYVFIKKPAYLKMPHYETFQTIFCTTYIEVVWDSPRIICNTYVNS